MIAFPLEILYLWMRRIWQGGNFPRAGNGRVSSNFSYLSGSASQHQRRKQPRLPAETWCHLALSSAFWSGFAGESHTWEMSDSVACRFSAPDLFASSVLLLELQICLHCLSCSWNFVPCYCSLSGERRCRRKGWLPLLILHAPRLLLLWQGHLSGSFSTST